MVVKCEINRFSSKYIPSLYDKIKHFCIVDRIIQHVTKVPLVVLYFYCSIITVFLSVLLSEMLCFFKFLWGCTAQLVFNIC